MRSDVELLDAWRRGEGQAGEALFERYFGAVSRFFYARVGGDVDDLVQQTFEACVTGRDRVREQSNFRAYVFGVAYNMLRRHYRESRRRALGPGREPWPALDSEPGPSTWMRERQHTELLRAALRRIPTEIQMILELHYFEELSSEQIARVVSHPVGTVRSRMRRGRELLRLVLDEMTDDERTPTLAE